MKGYRDYFSKKIFWFFVTLVFAVLLNFLLPRLMPGDPVASITARVVGNASNAGASQQIYAMYAERFGTNKPLPTQFVIYIRNLLHGDFGLSFTQYPRKVSNILKSAIPWTLCLQFPAILIGWIIGNFLGAIAAYIRKGFDKALIPVSLFLSGIPAFGMAITLLVVFAITLKVAPIAGGYGYNLIPNASWQFIGSVLSHYWLPFLSVVLVAIGGQAIGMRSMSIYELNADYVRYSRFLGIKDRKIVGYVFRNAMLPQITGLALSFGTMLTGALVAEIIFSYPGLGFILLKAISGSDYPLVSAVTLIITLMVLTMSFLIDIIYGLIDPRVKAAQID